MRAGQDNIVELVDILRCDDRMCLVLVSLCVIFGWRVEVGTWYRERHSVCRGKFDVLAVFKYIAVKIENLLCSHTLTGICSKVIIQGGFARCYLRGGESLRV